MKIYFRVGICAYAREDSTDAIPNLLFAKAKVAPSKKKTLPTLELLGVFLGMKCLPNILDALRTGGNLVSSVTFYLDAQVVLSWVLTGKVKTKNLFAANRIKDIKDFENLIESEYGLNVKFRYISTESNPADLLTRGMSVGDFKSKIDFWQHGPNSLASSIVISPTKPLACLSDQSRSFALNVSCSNSSLLNVSDYSNLNKLVNVTANVFKFVSKCKKKFISDTVCVNEARMFLIKKEQEVFFGDELQFLKNPKSSAPTRVKNLSLFLDQNGMVRSKGRLENCDYFAHEVNDPIVLPKQSPLTDLFIWHYHLECKHMGVGTTLNYIRKSGFWIPHIRTKVRNVIHKCIICKRINAHPFKYPNPCILPAERVNLVKPYEYTGIDFSGHIFVTLGDKVTRCTCWCSPA